MLNDKRVVTLTIAVEWWVLIGSLHTVPAIHSLSTRHELEWMTRTVGHYNEEIVREFYTSYVAALRVPFDRRSYPAK